MHKHLFRFAVIAVTTLGVAGCEQPQSTAASPSGIRIDPTAASRLRPILAAMREEHRGPAPLPESTAVTARANGTQVLSNEERDLRAGVHQREGAIVSRTSMSMEVPR